jgi:hypothetical protein
MRLCAVFIEKFQLSYPFFPVQKQSDILTTKAHFCPRNENMVFDGFGVGVDSVTSSFVVSVEAVDS